MSDGTTRIEDVFPRTVRAGRLVAAIVLSGTVAALAWMFILQEGHTGQIFGQKWTGHDFPDGLGSAFGFEETARAGLFLTLGLGVAVAALYALVEPHLPGSWAHKALLVAPVLFLAWGLLFTPLVDSHQVLQDATFVYLPTGFFGTAAGNATIVSGILASLVTGLLLTRIHGLVRDGDWWRENPVNEHGVRLRSAEELLEFTEERPEQRAKGPR